MIAEICGTPIPATIRVVQIEPGPIPTLTASAPASMSAFAAAPVAMFPAITCKFGYFALIFLTASRIFLECPCAESTTITSTCALTSASTRSIILPVIPTPAPQRRRPCSSFADCGYLICFSISLIVISPLRLKSLSTIGSFSFLAFARIFLASSRVIPSGAVIRFSEVMDSLIFLLKSVSNFKSRLVIIPTRRPSFVIGTPEIRNFAIRLSASASV